MALRNYILYYLLKTVEKIGLNPQALFRQMATEISKDKEYLSKKFFESKLKIESFEQLVKDILEMMKHEGLIKDYKLEINDNDISVTVSGCEYLHMAEVAKEKGEKACPICIIGLATGISAALVEGKTFESIEYNADVNAKECILRIKMF